MGAGSNKRLRTLSFVLGGFLLFVALSVALLVGINRSESAVPQPLWSEADLPAVPPPSNNGWVVLQRGMHTAASVQPPSSTLPVCNPDSAANSHDRWKTFESALAVVDKFLSEATTADALRLIGEATTKPVFVDACEVEKVPECPFLSIVRAHQAAELKVLRDAHADRWDSAWQASDRLLRMDLAHLGTARSGLSNMAALADTRRAVELLALLAHRYPKRPDSAPSVDHALLARPGAARDGVSFESLGMRRAVITEYLFIVRVIDAIQQQPSAAGVSHRRFDFVMEQLYDPAATRGEINHFYGELAAYAQHPGAGPAPTPPSLRSGSFWWTHNATGKLVLEEGLSDFGHVINEYDSRKKALVGRVKTVRQTLRDVEMGTGG